MLRTSMLKDTACPALTVAFCGLAVTTVGENANSEVFPARSVAVAVTCPAFPVGDVAASVLGLVVQVGMGASTHVCDINVMTCCSPYIMA